MYITETFDFWLTSPQFSTSVFFIYVFKFDFIFLILLHQIAENLLIFLKKKVKFSFFGTVQTLYLKKT